MSESDKSGKPELTAIPIVVYDPKPEAKALLQTNEPMIVVCGLLNQLRAARQTTQIESEFAQARIAELEAALKLTWLALRAGDTDEQIKAIEQAKPYIK